MRRAVAVAIGLLTVALSQPVVHAAPTRDLAVGSAKATAAAASPGTVLHIRAVVANRGRTRTPATSLTVDLSRDRKRGGDVRLESRRVAKLPARSRRAAELVVTIPRTVAAGGYVLRVCLDERRRIREEDERNNCGYVALQVSPPPAPPPPPVPGAVRAHLSGTLKLTDAGLAPQGAGTHTWQNSATLNVEIDVAGQVAGDEAFVDQGSTYLLGLDDRVETTEPPCFSAIYRTGTGSGRFHYSGDPWTDEIFGGFGRIDHSRITLGVLMGYDAHRVDKGTGPESECQVYERETDAGTVDGVTIGLIELHRTSATIVYQPVNLSAWPEGPSHWQHINGTLTLHITGGAAR